MIRGRPREKRERRPAKVRHRGICRRELDAARSLWEPDFYHIVLIDVWRYLPGDALEIFREIMEKNPEQRFAFLIGPPRYLSTNWPEEFATSAAGAAA